MTHPTTTAGAASPVLPGEWVADPAACTLAFAVRNFAVRTVTGHIPLLSAVVHVSPNGEPVSVRAVLDARGIRTGNVRRDNDLRGRRFLVTDRWPVIRFEADLIKPAHDAWTVSGTLTVKDTHCPVRLDVASFTIPADGSAQVDLRATGRLDRRSAGVTAGPAFLIDHQISLSLAVRLRHAGPSPSGPSRP
jgi:polyisoprenoid-binding protein YceI